MADCLDYVGTLADDAWSSMTDAGEIMLGFGVIAFELLLLWSILTALAPAIATFALGEPLWVTVVLAFMG